MEGFQEKNWHSDINCDDEDYPLLIMDPFAICRENFSALAQVVGVPMTARFFVLILGMLSCGRFGLAADESLFP